MHWRRLSLALRELAICLPLGLAACSGAFSREQIDIARAAQTNSLQPGDGNVTTATNLSPSPDPSVMPTPTLGSNSNAIISASTGLAMDLSGGASASGTAIMQYSFHGGSNQVWQLIPVPGDTSYFIENPASGKCVDVAGESRALGANIVLWDCTRSASQQWAQQINSDGTSTFVNRNSGLCMDVPGAGTAVARQLDQATCNGAQQQSWRFSLPYPRVGSGFVLFIANANNMVTSLSMTMLVPPKPASTGSLFLWPGLQPGGVNYDPINNGVLQPVLTWGGSCAPTAQPANYSTWWISGQYVNTSDNAPGFTGCATGSAMSVNVGDTLNISMLLNGTTWTQTIVDAQTNAQVTYSIDLQGQAQNNIEFDIEGASATPVSDVSFDNVVFTMAQTQPDACIPVQAGATDYVAQPLVSADKKSCTVSKIILRAQGVPATTANP